MNRRPTHRLAGHAVLALAILLSFATASAKIGAIRLPPLKIDPRTVTVSGISSGGFMAVQMHVAHSASISGAASVAGGIYWCSEGDKSKSTSQCMASPHRIQVRRYLDQAVKEAKAGRVDSLANLRDDKVYLFSSAGDFIIRQAASDKLAEFYSALLPANSIRYRNDFKSAHGFPTLDYGAACNGGGPPWLLNCKFNLAGEILSSLYGKLKAPAHAVVENLHVFDQTEFGSENALMLNYGFAYIPSVCASGAVCHLHVALHGCQMNPDFIEADFAKRAGFNSLAEANNIVVLYPNSAKSSGNPYACWDWFGFTGADYAVKSGKQMSVLKAVIDRVSPKTKRLSSRTR